MTKPARAKLTIRTNATTGAAAVESAVVETAAPAQAFEEPTCYARNRTEILFSNAGALITHDGMSGETEDTIAANVDGIFFIGAFAELRKTATFMNRDGQPVDEPSNYYALIVDPVLVASIDAQTIAADAAVTIASDDTGFVEDAVFSQSGTQEIDQLAAGPIEVAPVDAPEGEEVDVDLSERDIVFATTKNGAPCATLRMAGARTLMAFGPVAEALQGQTLVSGIISKGRSTDKIVAVRLAGANDLIVELPKAA